MAQQPVGELPADRADGFRAGAGSGKIIATRRPGCGRAGGPVCQQVGSAEDRPAAGDLPGRFQQAITA